MAARTRPDDFDLRDAIRRAEFTPAGTDAAALVELLIFDEDATKDVVRALLRIPDRALAACRARLPGSDVRARIAIARYLGRAAPDAVRADLLALLADDETRVRRAAVSALGRIGGEGVEDALLARLPALDPAETRALVESLGKIGGERASAALAELEPGDDAELARLLGRARVMRSRDDARTEASAIRLDRAPPAPIDVDLVCRDGLEALLLDELLELRGVREPRVLDVGLVTVSLSAPLRVLDDCRIALDYAFPLPDVRVGREGEVAAVVHLLDQPVARGILTHFTEGKPRIRLEFPGMGPRRSFVWEVAGALAARGLINDSREADWEARIRIGRDGLVRGRLVPRGRVDARFEYRVGDVPAASHPTIAAAIARLAGVRDDDLVWDPFVGSGQELVERAKLGSYGALLGTDLDPRALEVSAANLAAAGFAAELVLADATTFAPSRPVTLVVSNPPMGRRVHRGDVSELLTRWLENVDAVLADDGRLVFVSPLPRHTTEVLERLGFTCERALSVDMGGFDARLERWRRDPRAAGRRDTRTSRS